VLVDNASTDHTGELLDAWASTAPSGLVRVLHEARPGKTHALLTALTHVRTRYAAIVDDDNIVHESWFDGSLRALSSRDDIGVLGVRTFTRTGLEERHPEWLLRLFAIGAQNGGPGAGLVECEHVWGAGSWIDAYALRFALAHGWCPVLWSRSPGNLLGGEDTELCHALRLLGLRVYADDDIAIEHDVAPERLTRDRILRLAFAIGLSEPILQAYDHHGHGNRSAGSSLPGDLARCVLHVVRGTVRALARDHVGELAADVRLALARGRIRSRMTFHARIRQAALAARTALRLRGRCRAPAPIRFT
jgi:hypothetical protein